MANMLKSLVYGYFGPYQEDKLVPDFTRELALAATPDALLDHLNPLLFSGGMSPELRGIVRDALNAMSKKDAAAPRADRRAAAGAVPRVRHPEIAAEPGAMTNRHPSRRDFFRGACSTLGYGALLSTIGDLYRINALAQGADYRALVCVFLYGGNDANNLVMPRSGADYTLYSGARANLAIRPRRCCRSRPRSATAGSTGCTPP